MKIKFILTVLAVGSLLLSAANAGTVPEEARRHMARGQAAMEMAKSQDGYDAAVNEFREAKRLAPDWANAHYHLGLAEEKAGQLKEAAASLKQYLRLAPNAPEAEKIKERIYKLEYKAEQELTLPEIIDVLVSFSGWETRNLQGCSPSREEFQIQRAGGDGVQVPTYNVPDAFRTGKYAVAGSRVMKVAAPVLRYVTAFNVCQESVYDNHGKWPDYCFQKTEYEIEVVSKTLAKVTKKQLSGGSGITKCSFLKK